MSFNVTVMVCDPVILPFVVPTTLVYPVVLTLPRLKNAFCEFLSKYHCPPVFPTVESTLAIVGVPGP